MWTVYLADGLVYVHGEKGNVRSVCGVEWCICMKRGMRKMMVSIFGVYAWKEGNINIVAKVFLGLTCAFAKQDVEGNNQ